MKRLYLIVFVLSLLFPSFALAASGTSTFPTCALVANYTSTNGFIWFYDGRDVGTDYGSGTTGDYIVTVTDSLGNIAEGDGGVRGSGTSEMGSDLFDPGAGVFTAGTYSWVAYGTNAIANDANTFKVTGDGSNDKGAYNFLRDSYDLTSDLTIGAAYHFEWDSKVGVGDSVEFLVFTYNSLVYQDIVANNAFEHHIGYFAAIDDTSNPIRFDDLGNAEEVWLDNLKLYEVKTPGAKGLYVNWTNISPSFSYVDTSGYTVTIKKASKGGGPRSRIRRSHEK
jgi:hypothetical protein